MRPIRAANSSAPPRLRVLLFLVLLSACRVGPQYSKPTTPAPPNFKESAPAAYSSMPPGTWHPASPQDAQLKGKWWEMFNEPELNTLEDQLNIDNQNIAQFFQNFMAARAQVGEARAGLFPTVTADPSVTRSGRGGSRPRPVSGERSQRRPRARRG